MEEEAVKNKVRIAMSSIITLIMNKQCTAVYITIKCTPMQIS
jgi:hypothetical protein